MNWEEIVTTSELVYASVSDDKGFRTWSLKNTNFNVSFYEVYPVEDIDRIVCNILYSTDGRLEEYKIATILGFNVVDDFTATPKRYADKAELEIFRAIVKPVIDWGLITKTESTFILTELGYKAIREKIKFKFYTGKKILFESPNYISQQPENNLFFPYYSSLGVYSEITNKQEIQYDQVNLIEVFDIEETDVIKRHKLQSQEPYLIFRSEPTVYFSFESCAVDIRLYKKDNEYWPIIFYNNQISTHATELLNQIENTEQQKKKIEWGLYLKLIKDPQAILNYKTVIPFEDLLELDSLIKDSRLAWND